MVGWHITTRLRYVLSDTPTRDDAGVGVGSCPVPVLRLCDRCSCHSVTSPSISLLFLFEVIEQLQRAWHDSFVSPMTAKGLQNIFGNGCEGKSLTVKVIVSYHFRSQNISDDSDFYYHKLYRLIFDRSQRQFNNISNYFIEKLHWII